MFVYQLANELDISTVELFSKLKELDIEVNLPNPKLTHKTEVDYESKKVKVEINSENFAKGIYVTSNSIENFSDNFFDLPVNGTKTITIPIKNKEDIELLINSINLKSLWNIEH